MQKTPYDLDLKCYDESEGPLIVRLKSVQKANIPVGLNECKIVENKGSDADRLLYLQSGLAYSMLTLTDSSANYTEHLEGFFLTLFHQNLERQVIVLWQRQVVESDW